MKTSRKHWAWLLTLAPLAVALAIAWAADTKTTALTEDTAPTGDDLMYTVNDPVGSPASRKVTLTNLFGNVPGPLTIVPTLGAELVTAFDATCSEWSAGGALADCPSDTNGWCCNASTSVQKIADGTTAIVHSTSITGDQTYETAFTLSSLTGAINYKLGDRTSSWYYTNGSFRSFMKPSTTTGLTFTPSTTAVRVTITSPSVKNFIAGGRGSFGASTASSYFAIDMAHPLGGGIVFRSVHDGGSLPAPPIVISEAQGGSKVATMFTPSGVLATVRSMVISGNFNATLSDAGVTLTTLGTTGLSDMLDVVSDTTHTIVSKPGSGSESSYLALNYSGNRKFLTDQNGDVHFYGAYTDASNYEGLKISAAAGEVTLAAETAGTGTDNIDLALTPAGTGIVKVTSGIKLTPPAAQTIAAGNTIAADACGGLKQITAAGAVTTDTTNTFTAPAAGNTGCCMDVVNVGAENITLDNNTNFKSAGAGDVVMTANDAVRVCSNGTAWYQISALLAN